jgi:hypothetical protein
MTNIEDRFEDMRQLYMREKEQLQKDIITNRNLEGPSRWLNIALAERMVKMYDDMIFLAWFCKRQTNPWSS